MKDYQIRPTEEADLPTVMAMLDHSRTLMRADGNHSQWVGYPTEEDVRADVEARVSYLVEAPHPTLPVPEPVGTFAVVPGEEPTYAHIDHGRWIDDRTPYATVHRMAKLPGGSGIGHAAFGWAKQRHPHLRVDTHLSNRPMRHLLEAEGFVRCGVIYMPDGAPREAYEWWRHDSVPATLQAFVEQQVLPRYDRFDPAHRRDHARRVVARAMTMEPSPQVFTAAAMHDLGLACGREEHHLHSGRLIRECTALRRWFTEAEVELIAQAAEDHRASATRPPRSRLGCIVAEADRDVEPETIVRRTVEYGLGHYPELDREGHWQRTLQHLDEKYAAGGYLKLWLDPSPNAAPLAELRALMADRDRLRALFDQYFQP